MRILVIGQTSLHWGRLEFGNIGNYYVIDPFFKELRRVFPIGEIRTTLQLSDRFNQRYGITKLPLDLYYSWDDPFYLDKSLLEYGAATIYYKTGSLPYRNDFIDEVKEADLIIDFSGDVWGDNATFAGPNRFLIGLLKDRTAQLINKKVVMIAGSPGPFDNAKNYISLIREVFRNFALVTNRESVSNEILLKYKLRNSHLKSYACSSFLFFDSSTVSNLNFLDPIDYNKIAQNKSIGLTICGWNLPEKPYTKWPRDSAEYIAFKELIKFIIEEIDLNVVLFSHSNGFELTPDFHLIHGRDYPIVKQLYYIVIKEFPYLQQRISTLDGIYSPLEMSRIISTFEMVVSGRLHGAVAGLSQFIPTVLIDYGHEPKAHKLAGFSKLLKIERYIADPSSTSDLKQKVKNCWLNRDSYKNHLKIEIPKIIKLARQQFDDLKLFINN